MLKERKKWWVFLFALILIINLGTLVFFWLGHLHEQRMLDGPQLKEVIADELNFDEQQRNKFEVFVKEHQDKSAQIRRKIEKAKITYYQLNSPESIKIAHLMDLTNAYGELDQLNFKHFQDIRSICSKEQSTKFDVLMQRIISSGSFGFSGKKPRPH
ncbi:hypothetical protein V7S79_05245 [Aquirufa sp. ROCK-SH2]